MRSPFVVASVANFRHNYGVDRGSYVHRALDLFIVPDDPRWPASAPGLHGSPSVLVSPVDGILTNYNTADSGAGGYWVKVQGDNGEAWYLAHNARPPVLPKGSRVVAGQFLTMCGWSGNAGPGNATARGRRTEPHVHAEVKKLVGRQWYYCDPWVAMCGMLGLSVAPYKHDGIAIPPLVLGDRPLSPDAPTSPPRVGGGTGAASAPRRGGGWWDRLNGWLSGGIILPEEMETAWEF